jgi:hypothetical protein
VTFANSKEAITITFDKETYPNPALANFLSSRAVKKGGFHLERLAALLSKFYAYEFNEMYEVNDKTRAKDQAFQEGSHKGLMDLYKDLKPWHPAFDQALMIQPYEWLRVTDAASLFPPHLRSACISAKMAFHLTKEKIRDKYNSFSWSNLHDQETAHMIRKWMFDANAWLRSHECLKEVGFEEFAIQKVRLHISSTHFAESAEPNSWKINVRVRPRRPQFLNPNSWGARIHQVLGPGNSEMASRRDTGSKGHYSGPGQA